MKLIAGVDIGNSTTEVSIGRLSEEGKVKFLSYSTTKTTGTKGTLANVAGIKAALIDAMDKLNKSVEELSLIRINEATPVIGDTAMETITETIITESSMIGHNPSTPAGIGGAVGTTIYIENIVGKVYKSDNAKSDNAKSDNAELNNNNLDSIKLEEPYIIVASSKFTYEEIATLVNQYSNELNIVGLILQADEAVLVENRLVHKIPIVDEVSKIYHIPEGKLTAMEVALPGQSIRMLSNPYGIATLLHLTSQETRAITPIAKSLMGKRSGVVIKTPHGNVKENILPAGDIYIEGDKTYTISIDSGADKIMEVLEAAGEIKDIDGKKNTNIGNMLNNIKLGMSKITCDDNRNIRITDMLAVDTLAPVAISGSLAGETCMEKAVGVAAMVKTNQLPMELIAKELSKELHLYVKVAGVEGIMAALGALTTPGTTLPLAILDLGGGSTDAAIILEDGKVNVTHMAGAGELVSMLIQTELGLTNRHIAEQIKKYPLAKVESLFHMRLESGAMEFFKEAVHPEYYGNVVLLHPEGMIKIEEDLTLERIMAVRREAKRKVFVKNAIRALTKIAPEHNLKKIPNIVLVGGSAEDFEVPQMLMEEFLNYKIVCGRGNILGTMGPRNAVATGLVLSYIGGK